MTTTTGHYFKIGPYPKRFKKNYLQTTKLIELKLQCIYDRSFDCPLKSLFFIVSIGNPRWPSTQDTYKIGIVRKKVLSFNLNCTQTIITLSFIKLFILFYVDQISNMDHVTVVCLFVCLFSGVNTTFNSISVILWLSLLLMQETGGPGENH